MLLFDDQHLAALLRQYQRYFNERRLHQGIGQRVPANLTVAIDVSKPVKVTSVLGGLHVHHRRAARPRAILPDDIGSQHGRVAALPPSPKYLVPTSSAQSRAFSSYPT